VVEEDGEVDGSGGGLAVSVDGCQPFQTPLDGQADDLGGEPASTPGQARRSRARSPVTLDQWIALCRANRSASSGRQR
jgi:hypothetical protein